MISANALSFFNKIRRQEKITSVENQKKSNTCIAQNRKTKLFPFLSLTAVQLTLRQAIGI